MIDPDQDSLDASDMRRLAAGHDSALDALMTRHADKLFHYLVRQLRDEADAADLAQETFVRVHRHRSSYDPRRSFTTWLYTIATNLVRDRFKWRARHPEVSLESPLAESGNELGIALPDARPGPDANLVAAERAAAVARAVAALPEDFRTPLVLAEFENLPNAEIAAIVGVSQKAVESRLYRARQQLRASLTAWLKNS
jgi:RNA polymerase sigma-70 factor (ECF subfamily)